MDTNNLKGLVEAYSEVYAPQEVDEAVKGADPEMRKAASAERRGGDRPLPRKEGEKNAAHMARKIRFSDKVTKAKGHIPGYAYAEEFDIFDVVLEFLQVEGFAETLEEAQEIMANELDADDIEAIVEASYSAKAARAGKDIGKPGKAFAKIAASAAKRYGSKERGEKVAGAVLAKLRREEVEQLDELSDRKMRAYIKKSQKSHAAINKKWDQGTATEKEKLKSIGHEIGQERAYKKIDKRTDR